MEDVDCPTCQVNIREIPSQHCCVKTSLVSSNLCSLVMVLPGYFWTQF